MLSKDEWVFNCFTHNGTGLIKHYINGDFDTSKVFTTLKHQNLNLIVGRLGNTSAHAFKGDIDELGIWNKELSELDVYKVYKGEKCITNIVKEDTLNIYLSDILTTVYEESSAVTTVKVYPNPTDKNLTVSIDNPSNLTGVTIKVMDALSSEVHNELVTGSTQSIDVSTWTSGIYFLHILDGEKTIDIRKIVVNK